MKNRRTVWSFSKYGINKGDKLIFVKEPSMDIIVEDERHVNCNGEIKTLSRISDDYFGYSTAVPNYFTFNGRILSEIRAEKESRGE